MYPENDSMSSAEESYEDQPSPLLTLLDRATFLDTYLALPPSLPVLRSPLASSQPLSASQSLPSQTLQHQSPPHQPLSNQRSLRQSPQPQDVDHTDLPLSLPRHILDKLTEEGTYHGGTWAGIPKEHMPLIEDKNMCITTLMDIITRIAFLTSKYCTNIKSISGKWVNTSQTSLQSWSRNVVPGLKPDIIFAHEGTRAAEVFWSRTFSVLNIEKLCASEKLPGAQLNTYVSHIFAEQVDRLFVNAVTLRGWELQVYRFDRSGVVRLQDKINIHRSPEDFIQVIASFSYLSPIDQGWDPTCKVWDSATTSPRPSYELSQQAFAHCSVYNIPWVLDVADESFVVIGAVNERRGLSIWGRACFVVRAVTLEDWKKKNAGAKVYILKQCWQRLPGLEFNPKCIELRNGDSRTPEQSDRENVAKDIDDVDTKPFEEIVMERAGWTDRLRKSSMVELNGKPITTFDTVRKNHATRSPPESSPSREKAGKKTGTDTTRLLGSTATSSKHPVTMQNVRGHSALVTRTLVRLVFDRPGWPIERFTSKRELLLAVKMIVQELGLLYREGVIHRDVSPANLIISDSGGHIIDFDHSKIAFEKGKEEELPEDEDVLETAVKMLPSVTAADHYITALRGFWKITDNPLNRQHFRWPKKLEAVYRFGGRKKQNGFFTGTYQYLSHRLKGAPFHHCTHDLDSLFWVLNSVPLRFEGPGGKERTHLPDLIIDEYYHAGPENKKDMAGDFLLNRVKFDAMMKEYPQYFEDLTPFMQKFYYFVNIVCEFQGHEHHQPHGFLIKIIDEAIAGLRHDTEVGYEDAAGKERDRRQEEKADAGEAVSKQMTIAALLKERASSPQTPASNTANPSNSAPAPSYPPPVMARPSTPPKIHIPTVYSPETGRVVKRSRSEFLEGSSCER